MMRAAFLLAAVGLVSAKDDPCAPPAMPSKAYFGDYDNDQVFAINIANMSVVAIPTEEGPYPVDRLIDNVIYVSTRKANSVDVIDGTTDAVEATIALKHKPRSPAYNKENGLVLVAGGDKAMTSVIDVDSETVLTTVGLDVPVTVADHGGSLACGHPYWINSWKFLLLDRAARKIHMFNIWGTRLSSMATPTSVHHIIGHVDGYYYALGEGSRTEPVSPNVIRFRIKNGKLRMKGAVYLESLDSAAHDETVMGSHHADMHPNGVDIYVGSAEGNLFIVDRVAWKVKSVIPAGKGAGHTKFIPLRNLAIVTNHADTFLTIIDTLTNTKIKDLTVTTAPGAGRKSQGHTTSASPDSRYFYGAASDAGFFYQVDLITLEVTKTLTTGGYPLQGTFVW